MPEIAIPGYSVFHTLRHRAPDDWRYTHNYIRPNVVFEGIQVLGMGSENVAVVDAADESKVVAYSLKPYSSAEAITIFHTHRVLNTVFQHNFPRIHAAISGRPMYPPFGGTIREKVEAHDSDVKYPYSEVKSSLDSIDVPFYSEPHSKNVMVGADGGEYYVDIIQPAWAPWTPKHIDRITRQMQDSSEYSEGNLLTVERSGKRIYDIGVR